ncbi:hypothetical protein FACS1894195_0790 [Bacteroidia bacterium]|nr:hypothetical protein FACS1894195_0790 [Bacteroidia bacterium]
MKTIVKKRVKEESAMDIAINKLIKEGKPLSATAKYWLSKDYCDAKLDMRAILR